MRKSPAWLTLSLAFVAVAAPAYSQSKDEAKAAIGKAVSFYHDKVANHGGYVYLYSSDLTLRQAEGYPDMDTIWIQPPGTPAVGMAYLNAYEATKNPPCASAAMDVAKALVLTQMHSGGWYYSGTFGKDRGKFAYRKTLSGEATQDPVPDAKRTAEGGWLTWKQRDFESNMTTCDDNVTQSATQFLIRIDGFLKQRDAEIHEAATYALKALLGTQYPNGAWSGNFDRFPANGSPSASTYPVKKATYPSDWPRTWPKDFSGCYITNDNLHANHINTLVLAHQVYGEDAYLAALKKAGDFILLAQMPDPQPAWAQAYNQEMVPVWDRAFEPSAISGRESQILIRALMNVYRATGDAKYLEPIPKAIAYLRASRHSDGTLSRFYELQTNKPLYFTRGPGGKGHVMTYEREKLASNYGWIIPSALEGLEAEYRALKSQGPKAPAFPDPIVVPTLTPTTVADVIKSQDSRGAWTEPGTIRDAEGRKVDPPGGIIQSETFIRNVNLLSEFVAK